MYTYIHTYTQTHTLTHTQALSHTHIGRYIQAARLAGTQTGRLTNIYRQAGIPTYTDIHTGTQPDTHMHTYRNHTETGRQTGRHTEAYRQV